MVASFDSMQSHGLPLSALISSTVISSTTLGLDSAGSEQPIAAKAINVIINFFISVIELF